VTRRLPIFIVAVLGPLLAACGSGGGGNDSSTLVVFTDTVLESPATELVEAFESANPGVQLQVEVGATDELADRIRSGEHADIFIGDRRELDQMKAEEVLEGEALLLGSDVVVIAVPEGNPANVTGLDDFLADSPSRTAICAEASACGNAARQLFADNGIPSAPDQTDADPIRLIFDLQDRKVDAAILWRTHAAAASKPLDEVAIPIEYEMRDDFTVAGVEDNPTVERAVRWLATDPASEEILVRRGLRAAAEEGAS
jgi:molybdate transport system substrate-binding protein